MRPSINFVNRPISILKFISARLCGINSTELHAAVSCFRLNLNRSKLVYFAPFHQHFWVLLSGGIRERASERRSRHIPSRLGHSCSRLLYQNKSTRARNPASYYTQATVTTGHVRSINILTWLRGFQVKLLYLVLFSLYPSLFWELRDKTKKTTWKICNFDLIPFPSIFNILL